MSIMLLPKGFRQKVTHLFVPGRVWGLILLLLAGTAAGTEITVPFRGPASAHIVYDYTAPAGGWVGHRRELEFGFVDPSGVWNVLFEDATAVPDVASLSGTHHHEGLTAGTYHYQFRLRQEGLVPGGGMTAVWSDWGTVCSVRVVLDGQADGTLLFDETLTDAVVGDIIVPEGRKLTLRGVISPPLPNPYPPPYGTYSDGTITVYGQLDSNSVEFEWRSPPEAIWLRSRVVVDLHVSGNFSGMLYGTFILRGVNTSVADCTGGQFEVRATGASFTNCTGGSVTPYKGASIVGAQDSSVWLWALEEDAVATISYSTIYSGSGSILNGRIVMSNVDWSGTVTLGGESEVDADKVDFLSGVTVGNVEAGSPVPTVRFHSRNSRFTSLWVGRVAPTNFSVTNSLFSGGVEVIGGYPDFLSCEFGGGVALRNRTGAKFENCLFLASVNHFNLGISFADAPFWQEASAPSPIIANNAFMGQYGSAGVSGLYSVGANYYGDRRGYHKGGHGFLGYVSGHAGALSHYSPQSAAPLPTSPLSGARRDTRVFPKFWMNGYIIGQNTVSHAGIPGGVAGFDGLILKDRHTLVSVDVIASDNDLEGVRVYAKWNNDEIDALPRQPLQRDRSRYSNTQVRNGLATFNILLPSTDNHDPGTILSLPLEVYLDASQVQGFDPAAYPAAHQRLFTCHVDLSDPPGRPLRISVQPVQIRGMFGSSWGIPDPSGVIRKLRRDMPDMLPLRADDIEVTLQPLSTYWSSQSSVTTIFLMNRIAAEMAMVRKLTDMTSSEAADFIVVVLPKGIAANFDGTSLPLRRRIIFVGEHKDDAVLHELGHGIGLYLGWGGEQYDLFPPDGMLVERVTKFYTETKGRYSMQHLSAEQDFWHDGGYVLDIMGRIGPIWTAPSTVRSFHHWFQSYLEAPSRAAATRGSTPPPSGTRRILMSAAVTEAGEFIPDTLTAFDATAVGGTPTPPASSGDASRMHQLQVFSFIGTTLLDTTFYLEEGDPVWTATFDLPTTTDSYTVTRVQDGAMVFHVQSAGLVRTQFLSPGAGDAVGSLIEAEWSAETAEATNLEHLRHAVLYKTSPAGSWNWLVLPTRETQISASSAFLPDTDSLALRLITSDGVSSVEHVIEGLSVGERAPQVSIISPRNADQAVAGTVWELSAMAEDFGRTGLDAGSWTSSLDGPLGTGLSTVATLSPGLHELRYEVESTNGLGASAEVTVGVYDVMTELDLGLEESDLILRNPETTPEGYTATRMVPGVENTFLVNVRNQGVDATTRVQVFVQNPFETEMYSIGVETFAMEPFDDKTVTFCFEPEAEGTYRIRVVLDEVVPSDPNVENNSREWLFSTIPPGDIVRDESGRVTPTILWPAPDPIFYGVPLSATQLAARADSIGTFIYAPPARTVLPPGTHSLAAEFAPDDAANWANAQASVEIVVLPAPLTITAHDRVKTYGETAVLIGTEFTAAGLVGEDTVAGVQIASTGTLPGAAVAGSPYPITPSAATGDGLANYDIDYLPGTLTVLPAPLTATAEDKAKVFGSPNPTLTIRYEGLQYVDTAPATPPTATCGADQTSPPDNYAIVLTGGDDPNYTLTLHNGTLTVVEGVAMRLWADGGGGVAVALEFGEAQGAAESEDEWDAPTQPDQAARLFCPFPSVSEPRQLARDFRPLADLTRWRLVVGELGTGDQRPATRGTVVLTWDAKAAANGREVWLQELAAERPVGFPVDMKAVDEPLSVATGTVFEIVYGVPEQHTIELRRGWNAVGTPLLGLQTLGQLASRRAGGEINFPAWRWGAGGFEPVGAEAPFLPEAGYLLRCVADSATLLVSGLPPDGVFPLGPGWHLLSPVDRMAPPTVRSGGPAAWRWDADSQSQRATDTFEPGEAYWWHGSVGTTGDEPEAGEVFKSTRGRDLSPDAGDLDALVAGNTAFAIDLYHQWRGEAGNLFLSPHSISIALGMTYAGARGETAAQMSTALRFGLPDDRLHAAFNALDLELAARGKGAAGTDGQPFRLRVVNQLWGERTYSFLAPFLDTLAEHYGAGLRAMDFVGAAEPARLAINDWVAYQTEQRIRDLLPEGSVNALTRLVLTNAIYFNAAWQSPFPPANSGPGSFVTLAGDVVQAPMMRQTANFPAQVGASWTAVELPYDGGELSMLLLVPDGGTFADFERELTSSRLAAILAGLSTYQVTLTLPSFEYSCKASLKSMLAQLGMPVAFAEGADFSGIDGTRNLLISDVFHQAFVKVNEAGTEAAAATGVVVGVTSVPEPLTLTIDRPFLFLIRDHATRAVLFIGRVLDPGR